MIKFLHIADAHIDSAFANLDSAGREQARTGLLAAFRQVAEIIKNEGIPYCFVSGDLFDTPYPSQGAISAVKAAIASCPGCMFFVAPGNHDPYTADSVWAKNDFGANVTVFSSASPMCVEVPGTPLTVYGYAFTSPKVERFPAAALRGAPDRVNVLVAHADLGATGGTDAPVSEGTLGELGMNYIALGHIHNPPAPKKVGRSVLAYPGCTMGRDFGECGDKGVFVGTIEEGRIDLSFRRIGKGGFFRETVDVTGAADDEAVAGRITKWAEGAAITPNDKVRLTLGGTLPAGTAPDIAAIKAMIPPAAIWQIKDGTTPAYDPDELRRDISLRGEFYRKLLPMLEGDDPEVREIAKEALKLGLCAINGISVSDF